MAVDMFIKFDDFEGDSADAKHKGEIDVLSFSWGISRPVHPGSGQGTGKAQVSDFSFVRQIGPASPALFVSVCKGEGFDTGSFVATFPSAMGKKGGEAFYKVTFHDVLITSVSPAGSGEVPLEQVSLNFSKVEIEASDGKRSGKVESCDFAKGV